MSTGHVFHPGHDEWHGQTVVVYTKHEGIVVGRWDAIVGGQLQMHDVAVCEPSDATVHGEWLAKLQKYGIPVAHADYALPESDVAKVVRLRDA